MMLINQRVKVNYTYIITGSAEKRKGRCQVDMQAVKTAVSGWRLCGLGALQGFIRLLTGYKKSGPHFLRNRLAFIILLGLPIVLSYPVGKDSYFCLKF